MTNRTFGRKIGVHQDTSLFREFLKLVSHVSYHGKVKSRFSRNLDDVDKALIKRTAYRYLFTIEDRIVSEGSSIYTNTVSRKENLHSFAPRLKSMSLFVDLKIGEFTRLNLYEFLALPVTDQHEIIKICEKKIGLEDIQLKTLKDTLDKK